MRHAGILTSLLFIVGLAQAGVIKVPTDQPTIQAGINAASDFDTVLVESGTYTGAGNCDIILNKSVVIKSSEGASSTILDINGSFEQPRRAFRISEAATIDGFTIRNGYAPIEWPGDPGGSPVGFGGGIYVSTSATIRNCIFTDNVSAGRGGAIGIQLDGCCFVIDPVIEYCLFRNNQAGSGGAVFSGNYANTLMRNCTVAYNNLQGGSTIFAYKPFQRPSTLKLVACNLVGNTGHQTIQSNEPIVSFLYCNSFANSDSLTLQDSNINQDPLFCDIMSDDFRVIDTSPCLRWGNVFDTLIGAYGVGCASFKIEAVVIDTVQSMQNIVSHTPLIQWFASGPTFTTQDSVELQVGVDTNWNLSEKWILSPLYSADTFIVYNGDSLADGNTYFFRIRVHDGIVWSPWFNSSFRMNSVPTVPILMDMDVLPTLTPTLYLQNATDAQSDALSYDYEVYSDNALTTHVASGNSTETPDSTGWVVSPPLNEDAPYWWRAKSYDGYEYSGWSQTGSFYTNSMSSSPSASSLISPPDSSGKPLFNMLPTFDWSPSSDPDPFDTIRYKLEISLNVGFTFVNTIDSIATAEFTMIDSLEFNKHYWWRVTAFDTDGLTAQSAVKDFWTWTLGDVNHSHTLNIQDLNYMVMYFFSGGSPISPLFVGDLNGNCGVNVQDLIYLVSYFFSGGPPPLVGCSP